MKTTFFVVLGIIIHILGTTHSLIIPDELPSLLSIIYSNIPTIKKGTDSRIGWGFRFGDRADFQVLVELGPQTNTQPLGNQDSSSNNNKRNVQNNLSDVLYAQQQQKRKQYVSQTSNTDGGKWLNQWSQNIRNAQQTRPAPVVPELPNGAKPGLAIGEIDAKSVIPDDSTLMLGELYKKKEKKEQEQNLTTNKEEDKMSFAEKLFGKKVEEIISTTLKPTTTTSAKEALDNVDMEDDIK